MDFPPKLLKKNLIRLCVGAMCLTGCISTGEPEHLSWDDLTAVFSTDFVPGPEFGPLAQNEDPVVYSGRDRLRSLARSRSLEEAVPYHRGMLGRIGNARMFVSTRDRVRDLDQLYWVMVRVLSEKYGCFMTQKVRFPDDSVKILCRDNRQIVLWPSIGSDWIQFYSRQFDAEGYEIKVEKRRVVRISSRPEVF